MESVAFKEWAIVCEALGRGRQSIILRKGRIAEGRGGFSFRHREFFLFPTFCHEQPEKVREAGRRGGTDSSRCETDIKFPAGSDDKIERARALGAGEVIDHHRQDIAGEVQRITNRRGVDVVIEHVGEATWSRSVRSLARGGRLITCGATTGGNGSLDLRALFAKQLTVRGSYMGTKGELMTVARLFFDGHLAPVVDRTYPLAEAAAAQIRLEESAQFGKIVLEI